MKTIFLAPKSKLVFSMGFRSLPIAVMNPSVRALNSVRRISTLLKSGSFSSTGGV